MFCHVRGIRAGAVPVWNQPCHRAVHEWRGTLLFILITKGRAPAYLGSSFAFLAPAGIVISEMGYPYALEDSSLWDSAAASLR